MPKVSVIIPTYNTGAFIAEAIESVLAQTYTDYEIIVIDDGSTDDTRERLSPYAGKIRYFYQENKGRSTARNVGIAKSQGEYLVFLDADDLLLPNKLEIQVPLLDNHTGVGMIVGGHEYIDSQGCKIREERPWEVSRDLGIRAWLLGCPAIINAVLVRRDWVERVGGFDPSLKFLVDRDLWLRLASVGCPMMWSERIVCAYRLHSSNSVYQVAEVNQGVVDMLDHFFKGSGVHLDSSIKQEAYLNAFLHNMARAYAVGLFADARDYFERAIMVAPDLISSRDHQIAQLLAAMVKNPLLRIPDPDSYVDQVFDNLPSRAQAFRAKKRKVKSLIAMAQFFEAYTKKDWNKVLETLVPGTFNDPCWLLNRGVWSIMAKALVARLRPSVLPAASIDRPNDGGKACDG